MSKEMQYAEFVEVYDELYATTKRLEKETILAHFLKKLEKDGKAEWIYLLRGGVFPDYDEREFGVSTQLVIKAISFAFGINENEILNRYRKVGDLGELAEEFANKRKQKSLFSSKLTVGKVFENLQKLFDAQGKGAVKAKINLISELLGSATGKEAKYIVRTLLGQLRVGVADAILRDAIAEAFFADEKKEMSAKVEAAFDMLNDFAAILEAARKGKKALSEIEVEIGRPMNVMLPVKVTDMEEAFRICGRPAAIEHKYDGFRVVISKKGNEVKLFTRRLENVTKQFPDVVEIVKKYVKGKDFIIDSEVVGYDPKTKVPRPFEFISQRIKRKYDIDKLEKELPVEVNVFDVMYYNGKNYMPEPFRKRRELLEKIVEDVKFKIRLAKQIITDDEKVAAGFYASALKGGEEGIMFKNLDAPYQQGRRVGHMVKLKPVVNDLDLVIVGAEYGSGKRAGWLTSYIVACRENGEKYLEVGKVSSGLKEKEFVPHTRILPGQVLHLSPLDGLRGLKKNEVARGADDSDEDVADGGTSYKEMTALLKPLVISEQGKGVKVKPKIIVAVTYQNIQRSPSYSSGFALRFPRITAYRPDKHLKEIATLAEIEKEVNRVLKGRQGLG